MKRGVVGLVLGLVACSESLPESRSQGMGRNNVDTAAAATCEVRPPFTPNFEPELKWHWSGSSLMPTHNQVMMTPVVVEVNGDGIPDVVFNTFAGSQYTLNGVMRAISGADGRDIWAVTDPALRVLPGANIAAGDIDGDGLVELCTTHENRNIICFENTGAPKFQTAGVTAAYDGLSLADLDGDGTVELIVGRTVFDNRGIRKWTGTGGLGLIPFAADIDQDGMLEVVSGNSIYRHNGTLKCSGAYGGSGFTGVANFDTDPYGEVVTVVGGNVALMDDNCRPLWVTAVPGGGGGAPNIADFDNDGQPEIGVAGANYYVVFETNGTVRWQSVTRDFSSRVTGSSTFDFEGDGKSEVVYADELRLRIYDGATGTVRFDVPNPSGTIYENPVIVDVDGDNKADIVVASNNYAFAGTTGIRAFRDKKGGWVNTRRIWNQHAYSVTNVNEDGTIPARPATNWLTPGLNTFRSNSQGSGTTTPFAAPDVTVVSTSIASTCDRSTLELRVSARVRNEGAAAASAGMKVAFYRGNPASGGTRLGVATLPSVLAAGAEATVELSFNPAPDGVSEVFVVADDDGTGAGRESECREDNNTSSATLDLSCRSEPRWTDTGGLVGCHTKILHQSVLLRDGRVLSVGGFNTNADMYDPNTGTWSSVSSPARARRYHTLTALPDGRVLAVGGADGRLDTTAEVYDPNTDTWSPAASMATARRNHTATLLPNGTVLVTGGGANGSSARAEVYDPATNTWSSTGSLGTGRRQHTATLLASGHVLVTGGTSDSGARLSSTEVYDPASGTWSPGGFLGRARVYHSSTLLTNGKVLTAGGVGNGNLSAEVYDPATSTWSPTGDMVQPRRYHSATLLRSGRVLLAGGYDEYTGNHTSAELYDPASSTFSPTASLRVERYLHTATLLLSGKVLAVGGFSSVDQGSAELYEP